MGAVTAEERAALRERLAEASHRQWAGWVRSLLYVCHERLPDGRIVIPSQAVNRMRGQMNFLWSELPEAVKATFRQEADRLIAVIGLEDEHHANQDEGTGGSGDTNGPER